MDAFITEGEVDQALAGETDPGSISEDLPSKGPLPI